MTLLLSDADVRSVFDWQAAIATLRAAYASDDRAERFPARSIARGDAGWLRVLSGVPENGRPMGAKIIAAASAPRRVSYLIALFDQVTTELLALVDGNAITGYRTAATSALAVDLLAGPAPLTVGVLGSGFEAAKHLTAVTAVRPVAAARVFSPRPQSRDRFARDFADRGVPVSGVPTAPEAVAGASLVVCAARSRDESPILLGDWLEPGMTVVSIGSTVPEQREIDPAAIARADVIIADVVEEAVRETGDFIAAREAGLPAGDRVRSLADLVRGQAPGRVSGEQVALYKSVGSAVQDLAIASMCARTAAEAGLGTEFPVPVDVVLK